MTGAEVMMGAAAVSSLLGGLLGGGQTTQSSSVDPNDVFSRLRTILGPEGADEATLSALQRALAQQFGSMAMGGDGNLPPELSLANISSGRIPPAMQKAIQQASFGSMQQGIDQAMRQAQNYAMSKGLGLSSLQNQAAFGLMQPLMAQANQQYGQMMMQAMGQMQDLRNREIANSLALSQQSNEALNRLTQLRVMQGTRENLQMTRFPGGLPMYAYGPEGSGVNPITTRSQTFNEFQQHARDFVGGLPYSGGWGPSGPPGGSTSSPIDRGTSGVLDPYWITRR
jgi:hypothetical protein